MEKEWGGPGYYDLGRVYITPEDQLIVTFTGSKPFGVMVAVVYDLNGKKLGYWKATGKTDAQWFKGLIDYAKIGAFEEDNGLAFYGNDIFIGKSLNEHGLVHKYTRVSTTRCN